ncbi:peptidyl-prolyl cis-trans isomerase [Plasmodium gonderi]|uniref:Peptidyl-prolyl cis-trans isomerase n=1 Tax=Plasmodium gonderi TaxID=77519 RepID=A0A1Y1JFY8_PLAGO|nr:peptidyl-prolyl cis-trans isomerase [Plasmodium gonderi]GAW79004.1 peptidyl-prolyl cis-trans isomerase [Plasmodium gonderi]
MGNKKYVYIQLSMNNIVLGKVYIELFNDPEVKNSVENFLCLCRGNKYHSIYSGETLTYKNCIIEKVKKNKCIKSGYLIKKVIYDEKGNARPSLASRTEQSDSYQKYENVECIFGRSYNKEYSKRRHFNAGLLTMVQIEHKKYSSIFKITLNKVSKYNDKNIVIGRVVKNMHILRAIELIPVTNNYEPKICIYISDCAQVHESVFKRERLSSRQKYIDDLFATVGGKSASADPDADSDADLDADPDPDAQSDGSIMGDPTDHDESEQGDEKKQMHKKKKTARMEIFNKDEKKNKIKKNKNTEKKKGIELLNRILSDIDSLGTAESTVPIEDMANTEVSSTKQKRHYCKKDPYQEEKKKEIIHPQQLESSYEENISRKMTDREKRMLEIELKINQSKGLNEIEVKNEQLMKNSLISSRGTSSASRFDEYINYQYEKNNKIANTSARRVEEQIQSSEYHPTYANTSGVQNDDDPPSSDEGNKDISSIYTTSAIHAKGELKKKYKNNKNDVSEVDRDVKFFKKMKFNLSINRKIYEEKKKIFGENFYGQNLLINDNSKCTENDKNKVIKFCKKQEMARSKLSRKRNHEGEVFKNYINRRNKMYNKKLDRYFNKHTVEIRQNLERNA